MSREDKVRMMYECHMDVVYSRVDKARSVIEKLSAEIDNVELSEDEWRKLDELVTKVMIAIDNIGG